jgi:tetratricopeptide (TPR) repeat protein
MKEKNLQTLILSEYYSAILYFDRISFFLLKIPGKNQEIESILKHFYREILVFFNSQFCISPIDNLENENAKFLYQEIKKICHLSSEVLNLTIKEDFQIRVFLPLINLIYENAYNLHSFCAENNYDQIDLPRTCILKSKEIGGLPLFYLEKEVLLESRFKPILSLEEQRKNKYEEFLAKGLEAISFKNYHKAVEFLTKALNYKETAQVLSLLGWLYSLLNKDELAKEFCRNAIKLDPEFGPPYNDLGLIMMEEGDLKGSLKLFSLAKTAPKYQNREFPYINSGRIYMFLKKYEMALEELRMALTLVPSHQTLHNTVQDLLKNIHLQKICPSEEIN